MEFPLLVISKSELIRDQKTKLFIDKDPQIYAAFFFREDCYNTLTLEFHKDFSSYQQWLDNILTKITVMDTRCPTDALFLGTEHLIKFDPSAPIEILIENFVNNRHKKINGINLDSLSLRIIESVLKGKGIKTNENFLAKELNISRNTVERKINLLLEKRIISNPVCW
ncbi:MAG: hypothetical protein ACFFCQ_09605, partial [Promethearchaeota archaeon]